MKALFLFLFFGTFTRAQEKIDYVGTYSDAVMQLTLNADKTFVIKQGDPVLTYNHQLFESTGTWEGVGKEVLLNPHLVRRMPVISFIEKYVPDTDSVSVKINYIIETYDNEKLISRTPMPFERVTVYINKERNYQNLVHKKPEDADCLFGQKIENAYVLDPLSDTYVTKAGKVGKIGIRSYGFDDYAELIPKGSRSNYFEITIVQPLDTDRRPREKKVRISGSEAYYYEHSGKFNLLAPLYRVK